MLDNIKELKTTIPALAASVVLALVLTGAIPKEMMDGWDSVISGTLLFVLATIGVFSKVK